MPTRRRGSSFAAAVSALALLAGSPVAAETLADAVALAYQTNPNLQAQRAQLRAIDENYVQARAGYRPNADLGVTGQYIRRDRDNEGLFGAGDNDFTSDSLGAAITLNQPLYTGGRVSADIRATQADILSAREQLRGIESGVLFNVLQFYVDVRRDVEALEIRRNNVAVLRRQLEETNARFEVGEITRTDVAQAQARLAQAEALYASTQAQLAISRANYTATVGQAPADLAPEPPLPGLPASISDAFNIAEAENAEIRAADFSEQAANARVALARAAYRPTLGLTAQAGTQGRLGIDADTYSSELTIQGRLNVPLFTGGLNDSRVRQALEQENASRITVETRRREVNQQVSSAWNTLLSARAQQISNEEQVRATRVAFQGVQEEQRVGLRTTLDVLNAEQELRNAELALVSSRRDAYVAGASVLQAMGRLEAVNLVNGIEVYDTSANFNAIRREGGVPWENVVQRVDSFGAPRTDTPRRPQVPGLTPPETAPIATAGATSVIDPTSIGPIPQPSNIPAAEPFRSAADEVGEGGTIETTPGYRVLGPGGSSSLPPTSGVAPGTRDPITQGPNAQTGVTGQTGEVRGPDGQSGRTPAAAPPASAPTPPRR